MNGIKAILHDWDDTITGSFMAYKDYYFDLAKLYNYPKPNIKTIKKYWGEPVAKITHGIWPKQLTEESAKILTAAFERHLTTHQINYNPLPFSNMTETFKNLVCKNYILGVITSGYKEKILRSYKTHIDPVINYHAFIFDHRELGVAKPDPKVFDRPLAELASLGIRENEVIFVGDAFHDYFAALNRGLTFYAVTTGLKTRKDFGAAGLKNEFILDTFAQLSDLL